MLPREEEMENCTRVFGYGSNHPAQLAERMQTTEESIWSRSVAGILPGYTRCYTGRSRKWDNQSVATIEKYLQPKFDQQRINREIDEIEDV